MEFKIVRPVVYWESVTLPNGGNTLTKVPPVKLSNYGITDLAEEMLPFVDRYPYLNLDEIILNSEGNITAVIKSSKSLSNSEIKDINKEFNDWFTSDLTGAQWSFDIEPGLYMEIEK